MIRRQLKFALVKDCDALPSEANEKHPQLKHHIWPGSQPDLFRFNQLGNPGRWGSAGRRRTAHRDSFKLFDKITGSSFILRSTSSNCWCARASGT